MSALKLALVQFETRWHDAPANRGLLDALLREVPSGTDLVVLPEMFTTGFTMRSREVAETLRGETLPWLAERAAGLAAAITGSLVIEEGGRYYNRLVWMEPDGTHRHYDKRHLFRMAGEHTHYSAGGSRLVVEWRGFRVFPLVCYDLRFPVFARNRSDYDVLVVVANWPAPRQLAWNTLLRARAIENLCYAVGVNRVGTDGNGLAYRGGSAVYDYAGEARLEVFDRSGVFTVELDSAALAEHRRAFPAWQDADPFELR